MEKINTMQEIIEWFEGLADGSVEPFDVKSGLCSQIDVVCSVYMTNEFIFKWDELIEIEEIYESWDKFSGRHRYPVPAPEGEDAVDGITCPEEVYQDYGEYNLNMWKGAYGDLRKELCQHVANELRKLI